MTSARLRPPADFRGRFLTGERDLHEYAGASGILTFAPAGVALPRDAADVSTLVRWARDRSIPLVPRGAATGMPGGNVGPGVVLDLAAHLRSVGPVDATARTARVEPGATHAELNAACAPDLLHLPVDPSSGDRCTLGGMLANNSAGAHSLEYGAMRPWAHSLDLVLADGSAVTVTRGERPRDGPLREILAAVDRALMPGREAIVAGWPAVRKNSSGYALREYLETGDAVDLIVGSEGTLALIVGATVRLAPTPAHRGLALLEFVSLDAAGRAIRQFLPLRPATCEILDRTFLEMVRRHRADSGYPLRAGLEAILLVEVEGSSPAEIQDALERLRETAGGLASHVTVALDPNEQKRLWEIRRAASPIIAARADGRVSMQFIEDGVVPVSRLPEYILLLREVLDRHRLPAVIFGHAGDGNLHVNPLVDVAEPGWRRTVEAVLLEVADGVARLGGTLAGEHGDGRLRAPLLETIWGPEMVSRFRAVKDAFDPGNILNPGVVLPLPGQHPLDGLRPPA